MTVKTASHAATEIVKRAQLEADDRVFLVDLNVHAV